VKRKPKAQDSPPRGPYSPPEGSYPGEFRGVPPKKAEELGTCVRSGKTLNLPEDFGGRPDPDLVRLLREQVEFLKQELKASRESEREMRRELLAALRPWMPPRVEGHSVNGRGRIEDETIDGPVGHQPPWMQELYASGAMIPPEETLNEEELAILRGAEERDAALTIEDNARSEGYTGIPLTEHPEPEKVPPERE